MQVGGIGSGNSDYGRQGISHQVTECIHEHGTAGTQTGAAGIPASSVSFSASPVNAPEAQAQVSFWDRLTGAAEKGKNLLGRLWRGNSGDALNAALEAQTEDAAQEAMYENAAQVMSAQLTEDASGVLPGGKKHHESQVAAAASAVQAPQNIVAAAPYFTANSDPGKVKEPLLVRIRIRFRDITGYLSRFSGGRLAGRFQTKSGLKNGGRQTGQSLRRSNRALDKDAKTEGVVSDDSHLMDSYDSTGRYSRLGTGNNRKM